MHVVDCIYASHKIERTSYSSRTIQFMALCMAWKLILAGVQRTSHISSFERFTENPIKTATNTSFSWVWCLNVCVELILVEWKWTHGHGMCGSGKTKPLGTVAMPIAVVSTLSIASRRSWPQQLRHLCAYMYSISYDKYGHIRRVFDGLLAVSIHAKCVRAAYKSIQSAIHWSHTHTHTHCTI